MSEVLSVHNLEFEWKRPGWSKHPKVWRKFTAKDNDSDALVEYRIEDLPESRFEEAISVMGQFACRDGPLSEAFGM